MALHYVCCVQTGLPQPQWNKLLMREADLSPSSWRPDAWIENAGLTVSVHSPDPASAVDQLVRELFGFQLGIRIMMRPTLSGPHWEQGYKTMIKVVACALAHEQGELAFSRELERLRIIRKSGRLLVRQDYMTYLNAPDLSILSSPNELAPLAP